MKLINSIHNCQVLFRKNNLPLEDLTGRQHTFIFSICESPGRTQDSIAQELHLDKSTVARALAKLEQTGYVERKSNPNDNRELFVFPTEKALGIFTDVKTVAKNWARQLSKNISKEEMQIFGSVLKRMHENAVEAINSIKE